MESDLRISGMDGSATIGSDSEQTVPPRLCQMLQPAADCLHTISLSDFQLNFECAERIIHPTRHQTEPSSERREHQGAVHRLHTSNENGDWLALSLKFPAKPAVNVLDIGKDDLRLSLDVNIAAAPPAMEDFMEVQPREENEVTISGIAPLVRVTSAEDLLYAIQPGNSMGRTNGVGPIVCHPPVMEPNFGDQRLPGHVRGKKFHEKLTLEPLKYPVSLDSNQRAELAYVLFDDQIKPQEKGFSVNPYRQITQLDNLGKKGVRSHDFSSVQTVGHSSGKADRSRTSMKPTLPTENGRTMMSLLKYQARQVYSVGNRNAMPDKLKASCSETTKKASEGQNVPFNSVPSVEKIHLSGPSITWNMKDKPDTSGYCFSSCWRHVQPEHVSTVPCSLHEHSQVSPNNESSFVEISCSSGAHELRPDVVPVIPCQNSAILLTRVTIEEQCEHRQMEVLLPWQPSDNQLGTLGNLDITKSKSGKVSLFETPAILSNPHNDRPDSGKGRPSVGVEFSLAAQVFNKSRTPGILGSRHCDGLDTNDVACCSLRLPPRQASTAVYTHTTVDKLKYELGKIVNQGVFVEDSHKVWGEKIPLDSCDCLDIDFVNFDNEGEGENLDVEPKCKRPDVERKGGIHRIDGSGQGFEHFFDTGFRHSKGHFVLRDELQTSPTSSLVRCPISNVCMEPQANFYKRKLAMSVVEEIESENNNNYLREIKKCTATSLRGPEVSEKWKTGSLCDLCCKGPSLSLGEWYAWCCGLPASRCWCPEQKKWKHQMAIGSRKTQKRNSQGWKISQHQWSGKVHKMCALWSSEVYEEDYPPKGNRLRLLEAAVKRGKNLFCKDPECRKAGATLGCRVKTCRRSYHYPCAEKLSSRCLIRMWDCLTIPIACASHRYVEFETDRAKERFLPRIVADFARDWKTPVPRWKHCLGSKLLSKDIAEGQEAVQIPCTNDVDGDPMPKIKYITQCWCKGSPVDDLHPVGTELAQGCNGCGGPNFDCWSSPMSVHILGTDGRESDERLDWQSEYMHGRLPYNAHGLLQLGAESKDVVECNSRCKCGEKCKNRELQKGLRVSLELFKTTDRGWGVRSLQQIPRGCFVVEYVGEVLTQAEAEEQAEKYDENQMSYLFNLDHPQVAHEDSIVLDGIHMSNIARFINHSCEGNLMIYRVYSETTVCKYFRIGMFAIQDIEVGDELLYDYNYAVSKEWAGLPIDDPTALRCLCGAQSCRKWLWLGGSDTQLKH